MLPHRHRVQRALDSCREQGRGQQQPLACRRLIFNTQKQRVWAAVCVCACCCRRCRLLLLLAAAALEPGCPASPERSLRCAAAYCRCRCLLWGRRPVEQPRRLGLALALLLLAFRRLLGRWGGPPPLLPLLKVLQGRELLIRWRCCCRRPSLLLLPRLPRRRHLQQESCSRKRKGLLPRARCTGWAAASTCTRREGKLHRHGLTSSGSTPNMHPPARSQPGWPSSTRAAASAGDLNIERGPKACTSSQQPATGAPAALAGAGAASAPSSAAAAPPATAAAASSSSLPCPPLSCGLAPASSASGLPPSTAAAAAAAAGPAPSPAAPKRLT